MLLAHLKLQVDASHVTALATHVKPVNKSVVRHFVWGGVGVKEWGGVCPSDTSDLSNEAVSSLDHVQAMVCKEEQFFFSFPPPPQYVFFISLCIHGTGLEQRNTSSAKNISVWLCK